MSRRLRHIFTPPEGVLTDEVLAAERDLYAGWDRERRITVMATGEPSAVRAERPWNRNRRRIAHEFIDTEWAHAHTRNVEDRPPTPKVKPPPKPKRQPRPPHMPPVNDGHQWHGQNIMPAHRTVNLWTRQNAHVTAMQVDDPWDPVYCRAVMMAAFRGGLTLDYVTGLIDDLLRVTALLHKYQTDAWEWVPREWLAKTKPQAPWWTWRVKKREGDPAIP